MSCGGECPHCVRVECTGGRLIESGGGPGHNIFARCGWVGYRLNDKKTDPCPWCSRTSFWCYEVHHRLGGGCVTWMRESLKAMKRGAKQ